MGVAGVSSLSVGSDRELLAGAVLRMQAELAVAESLPTLPSVVQSVFAPLFAQLPPQVDQLGADPLLAAWINAAAVAEAHGFHDGAVDLIEALRRLAPVGRDDAVVRPLHAFLWTRRGRIARLAGNLDDAEHCYREALKLAPSAASAVWWSDVLPNAWLGLAILAAGRGNYPTAQKEATKALATQVAATQQVQAHLMLGLVMRKRGKVDAALRHIWQAYDLLTPSDVRRADVLVTLSELAADVDEYEAALHARLSALALPVLPRVGAAALGGLLELLAKPGMISTSKAETSIARSAWGRRVLAGRAEPTVVDRLIGHVVHLLQSTAIDVAVHTEQTTAAVGNTGGLTPHDQVVLALGIVRLVVSRAQRARATVWLDFVEALAERHGFHERQFQVDVLRTELAASAPSNTTPVPRRPVTQRPMRGKSWDRFTALEEATTETLVRSPG